MYFDLLHFKNLKQQCPKKLCKDGSVLGIRCPVEHLQTMFTEKRVQFKIWAECQGHWVSLVPHPFPGVHLITHGYQQPSRLVAKAAALIWVGHFTAIRDSLTGDWHLLVWCQCHTFQHLSWQHDWLPALCSQIIPGTRVQVFTWKFLLPKLV